MFQAETFIRTRYGETDQMGVVYYGTYPLYYEQARTEALRSAGFSYRELEESGVVMPVSELSISYRYPARFDDLLRVVTLVKELPSRKMVFHTEIYNAENTLLNHGQVTLLFVKKSSWKVISAPPSLIDVLKPYFGHNAG